MIPLFKERFPDRVPEGTMNEMYLDPCGGDESRGAAVPRRSRIKPGILKEGDYGQKQPVQ